MKLPWEQKLKALNAIGEVTLRMREPGDWYASQSGVSIADGLFESGGGGDGSTPKYAVEDLWRQRVDELPQNQALMVRGEPTRYVRWNGFMWADVERPERKAVRA